jgi:hypothetical protein
MIWSARDYTLDGIFRPRHPGQERRAPICVPEPSRTHRPTLICSTALTLPRCRLEEGSTIDGDARTDAAEMPGDERSRPTATRDVNIRIGGQHSCDLKRA